MSDIDRSLYNEVLSEIAKIKRPVSFKVSCEILIEGRVLVPYRVIHIDVNRLFHVNYSDEITIELAVSQGDFLRHIYPNRSKLQLKLKSIAIGEIEEVEIVSIDPIVRLFSVVLYETRDMDLQNLPATADDNTLIDIRMQLLEMVPERLRLQTFGTVFYKQKPSDAIKTMLGKFSKALRLPKEVAVQGIDLYEFSNDTVRENMIVPDYIPLLDMVGYMHKKCGGLYNTGAGLYFHANLWWIYPYFDDKRYEKEEYVLDIFVVPPNRLPGTERTYRAHEKRLQILSTGGITQFDSSDIDHLSVGNGVMFNSAKKFFNEIVDVSANIATADKTKTSSRFMLEKREGEFQYAPWSNTRFTDNMGYEMSKLRARTLQTVALVWDNARPELLYPGMPVKMYYGKEVGSDDMYGTLAAVQEHTKPNMPGVTLNLYKTTCVLTVIFAPK